VRDLEKDLTTRQTQEKEQEFEKIGGKPTQESAPRKETTYFRVTRNIVKEEVPFKRFKFQTNYEPRRLQIYVQLATKYSETSEQWQENENKLVEAVLSGYDPLLERNEDSCEHDETVESEKSNDSDDCDSDSSGGDNYFEDSENSNSDDKYPVNPNDYNGDDDDNYPEKAKGDNNDTANSKNYIGDDNTADSNNNDNSENSNDDIGSDNSNDDIGSNDYDIGSDDYDSYENYNDTNSDD